MAASGAKRSFGDSCLNRTISNLAREVFYLCTLLPNSALRARPNVRYEGQRGKHVLGESISPFDPSRTSVYGGALGADVLRRHRPGIMAQCPKLSGEMMRTNAHLRECPQIYLLTLSGGELY